MTFWYSAGMLSKQSLLMKMGSREQYSLVSTMF